jgi:hypothetical protein
MPLVPQHARIMHCGNRFFHGACQARSSDNPLAATAKILAVQILLCGAVARRK